MRTNIAAFVLVAVSLGLGPTVHAQAPIKIGASLSLTGANAATGQNQQRGYQLCVKHANAKGGVLGRKIELVIEDDQTQEAAAVRIYEKLITQIKVDAVLGPYASEPTEAVANVTEKHRIPMVAPMASTSSIFKKGRKYVFMLQTPAESYLAGLIEIAAKRGLKTVAVLHNDTLFPRASVKGAVELATKKGLKVVIDEEYPKGATDFSVYLKKIRTANPDVVMVSSYFEDAVAITRQMKELDVNPKMYGVTIGGDLLKFHETLGKSAEYVYAPSQWVPELVTIRAGGMIPIARQYPGASEFVEAHHKEFPGAEISYHSAGGYAGCEVLLEAIKRAGSLDREKVRAALLKLDFNTIYGGFKVDADGFQIAHKILTFQWQDGKKAIVWPDEIAPGSPRFPTPEWSKRP